MSKLKDPRTRYFISPVKLVTFDPGSGTIDSPEALLKNDISICKISSNGESKPYIVFDFGRELNGGIMLEIAQTKPLKPTQVNLCFGESVSEAMMHPEHSHAIHEIDINIPAMSKQEFGQTGFRFLKITLTEPDTTIEIRNVSAVALEYDWEYKGSFHSSDPLLNNIWEIGARTVHLCCQDYILDGIKRDRLVWMGDIHPQIAVIAAAFGNHNIVSESLDYLCNLYPVGSWMNNIASYSLWWIITVWEWYNYTGNKAFLADNTEYLDGLLEEISKTVDKNGNINTGKKKDFLEWASAADDTATYEGLHALMIWALKDAKLIFNTLGSNELYAKSDEILARLNQRTLSSTASKQVNSLRVLAGITSAMKTNENYLSENMCNSISPWFGCYLLRAKALAGDYMECIKFIREYWGGMLKLGATSFWEHFDTDWLENAARIDEIVPAGKKDVHAECGAYCFTGLRHSLCHGWAGNPTAWLSEHVLGIKIMEPGCRTVKIEPHLGDLTEVEGAFPTPHGIIRVHHKVNSHGNIESKYKAPENIKVISKSKKNADIIPQGADIIKVF